MALEIVLPTRAQVGRALIVEVSALIGDTLPHVRADTVAGLPAHGRSHLLPRLCDCRLDFCQCCRLTLLLISLHKREEGGV